MVCSGYPTVSWRVGSPEKGRHVQVWVIPSFPSTKKIPGSGLLGFDFDTLETFFQSQGSGTVRKRNSFREKWAGMIFSSEAYSNLGCAYLVKKCKWAIDDLCCPLLKWRATEHGEAWTPTRKKSKGVLQIERLGTLCRVFFWFRSLIFFEMTYFLAWIYWKDNSSASLVCSSWKMGDNFWFQCLETMGRRNHVSAWLSADQEPRATVKEWILSPNCFWGNSIWKIWFDHTVIQLYIYLWAEQIHDYMIIIWWFFSHIHIRCNM